MDSALIWQVRFRFSMSSDAPVTVTLTPVCQLLLVRAVGVDTVQAIGSLEANVTLTLVTGWLVRRRLNVAVLTPTVSVTRSVAGEVRKPATSSLPTVTLTGLGDRPL